MNANLCRDGGGAMATGPGTAQVRVAGRTGTRHWFGPDDQIASVPEAAFISVPEWARRVGVSKDSAYKAARLGEIPGCFAVGRLYRVNWSAFVERSRRCGGDQTAEEVGGVLIAALDHVCVDPKCRGGV